ncbi:MAG: HPr family phosphocarrier protein [Pseudobutyrivibrio sp.]|nr:HPr family phosphocarrier protein [Pseudobutyrivibrio sp.]
MVRKDVTISMTDSMESTPIAHLVQLANQFSSRIYFEMDTKKVNAKSIMGMMSLVLTSGDVVTIDAEGADDTKAVEEIEKFLTK